MNTTQCAKAVRGWPATWLFSVLFFAAVLSANATEQTKVLWQIGNDDGANNEFALAPKNYANFEHDGVFLVGRSDPKTDWPYVHPGPGDQWAGGRSHTFTVVFGLAVKGKDGTCKLHLKVLDPHSKQPPTLRFDINGSTFDRTLPEGAGDASINGDFNAGKPCEEVVEFPASILKQGNNHIQITTVSGSWMLYDSLSLETPTELNTIAPANYTALFSVQPSVFLVERDGRSYQKITARVVHTGDPIEVDALLGRDKFQTVQLKTGTQVIELFAPAEGRVRKTVFSLSANRKVLAMQPITLVAGVREIVVVFKTHFDIGYTDMASNIVQRYRTTMIDQALDVVDQNRDLPPQQQFAWTLAGWPLHKILEDWPGQSPERKQRIEKALKEGRFVLHGLPFTTHTELLEPEDLVRGLGYSSQIARRLGLDLPRDGKMTDVPEHSWMMATLLNKAGIDFMMIGCNGASAALQVPPLFWWQGPDGSRVLTMYSPDYGTELTPPADWPYQTWLACLHTGDNHGPPRPEEVKKVLDRAAKQFPGVKVRIGKLADFGDAILAQKPELPVIRRDAPDTWIHGPMSDPAGAHLARTIRPMIGITESLNTQLPGWGVPIADATPAVRAAYEQSLLYGEHTWGGAIYWVGNKVSFGDQFKTDHASGKYQRLEDSWNEHTAYIENACKLITPELDKNIQALANQIFKRGPRVVVYNPLPWKRSGLVTIKGRADFKALKAANGSETFRVEREAGEYSFFAKEIPAMGYKTFVPTDPVASLPPVAVRITNSTMENTYFRATLDPKRGVITSLVEKTTGRELVDSTAEYGMGQYLYERFDNDQVNRWAKEYCKPGWVYADFFKPGMPPTSEKAYQSISPKNFELSFVETPIAVTAMMKSAANEQLPAVTTSLVVYRERPYVDLEITVHDKPIDPWPEAAWLCLPFKVDQPKFQLGRLGSIIDPAQDVLPGANRHIFGINSGVAVVNPAGKGVAFCALDNPLISLEKPGCWKYSTDFVPRKPTAFVNLFNNQWNTNFRLWNKGTWKSRVRLWAVNKYEAEPSLITPSLEARYPLVGATADGAAGTAVVMQRGLELSQKGVLVTAFGANPDGPGTILRVWEQAGQAGLCRIWLPQSMNVKSVQPVDFRGRSVGEPMRVHNRSFVFKIGSFEPLSFVVPPVK